MTLHNEELQTGKRYMNTQPQKKMQVNWQLRHFFTHEI